MRIFIGTLVLITVLLIATPTPNTSGQSGIVVNDASTIRMINPGMPSVNMDVQARIAMQYGNSLRYLPVGSIPSSLQALSDGVAQRMSVQYANNIQHISLAIMPNTFQTLLSSDLARIVFQYVNSNQQLFLSYPSALLHDTIVPLISNTASTSSRKNANITWNTDEFTRYNLQYGIRQGSYTEAVEGLLYAKQHTVTLPNLVSGATYYFQVTSIDQSGNQSTGPELSFIITPSVSPSPTLSP